MKRIVFLFLGVLFTFSLGKEFGYALRGAETIMNFIFTGITIFFLLLFHWLVANGLNRRKASFSSREYWSTLPISLCLFTIATLMAYFTNS